jgi:hypothetical protein
MMVRISAVHQASVSISNPKSGTRFRKKQSSDELIRSWPSVEVASFSLRFRGHLNRKGDVSARQRHRRRRA